MSTETIFNGRIQLKSDTTANWATALDFIPKKGEIIIYTDYASKTVSGQTINIPNFKIGDGLAYGIDLPFVSDDMRTQLTEHINNSHMHLTDAEREFWNNKINCEDSISNEILVLTRI